MDKQETSINCPTFQKQELVIRDITNKINAIQGISVRRYLPLHRKLTQENGECDYKSEKVSITKGG